MDTGGFGLALFGLCMRAFSGGGVEFIRSWLTTGLERTDSGFAHGGCKLRRIISAVDVYPDIYRMRLLPVISSYTFAIRGIQE